MRRDLKKGNFITNSKEGHFFQAIIDAGKSGAFSPPCSGVDHATRRTDEHGQGTFQAFTLASWGLILWTLHLTLVIGGVLTSSLGGSMNSFITPLGWGGMTVWVLSVLWPLACGSALFCLVCARAWSGQTGPAAYVSLVLLLSWVWSAIESGWIPFLKLWATGA
ncbi:MAG: hypothetical protein ACFCUX_05795 [Candidatus Methylacidiphilales bacterium]